MVSGGPSAGSGEPSVGRWRQVSPYPVVKGGPIFFHPSLQLWAYLESVREGFSEWPEEDEPPGIYWFHGNYNDAALGGHRDLWAREVVRQHPRAARG